MRPNCLLARVLEALPGHPCGVESPDLATELDADPAFVTIRLTEAVRRGLAWAVRHYAANNRSLWFATEADRENWREAHPEFGRCKVTNGPMAASLTRQRRKMLTAVKNRQREGVPAGVHIAKMPLSMQTATNPNGVLVQVIPSPTHDARYQCAPGEQPYGAGFAAVRIGRDLQTGEGWAQA